MKAEEIKQLRKELGWSQDRLGQYLGYTGNAVRRWENDMSKPPDPVMAVLIQIRSRLDQKKNKERKEEFIQDLVGIAIGTGIVGFMRYIFNEDEETDEEY